RFPAWFPVDEMADVSRKLMEKREPAMYGDELSTTPADLIFSRQEAKEALSSAEQAHEAVKKLFAEYSA
ncbi:MAG: DNA-binding protein, partial [Nitrososphaerota archaeon]|nr:DNA-binding protein [Nitrososphaerota archaeon]